MRRRPRLPLRFETLEDRLTPALALDPSFGIDGRTFLTPGPVPQYASLQDAVVRPDGKIWALGRVGSNPVLARFNPNGELDATFDGDGIEPILSWSATVNSFSLNKIALQADGRVVLAGTASLTGATIATAIYPGPFPSTYGNLLAMRVNEDGSLDGTFGDGGRTLLDLGNATSSYVSVGLYAVRVLGDGRIALAGNEYNGPVPAVEDTARPAALAQPATIPSFVAARLTADGRPDTSYDGDGTAFINLGDTSGYYYGTDSGGAAILGDGRVVFAAARATPYTSPPVTPFEVFAGAYRLAADGARDAAFGTGGYAETRLAILNVSDGHTAAIYPSQHAVGVQPDGKVIVAVSVYSTTSAGTDSDYTQKLYATRFTDAGIRDNTFGDNGQIVAADFTSLGTTNRGLNQFTVLDDGRLAVLTYMNSYGTPAVRPLSSLTLFAADGGQDSSFTLPVRAEPRDSLSPTFLFADGGNLYLGGATDARANQVGRIGLVRLANDPAPVPPTANNQNAVGRFVATTGARQINLDPAFAGGSPVYLTTDLGPTYAAATATAVSPDGKYYVLASFGGVPIVARFNPDGTLDATFDGDGVRSLRAADDTVSISAYQFAVQGDGKTVVAGTRYVTDAATARNESRPYVLRLNADGSDDTGFGDGGTVLLAPARTDAGENLLKVATLATGHIVVLGQITDYTISPAPVTLTAHRLNADGTPDRSYGTDGTATVSPGVAGFDQVGGSAILADGSVVIAGVRQTTRHEVVQSGEVSVRVVRLAANGTLDAAFNGGGVAEAVVHRYAAAIGYSISATVSHALLAVQPGGAVVVGMPMTTTTAGNTIDGTGTSVYTSTASSQFLAVRFAADGKRDTAFGDAGTLALDRTDDQNTLTGNTFYSYLSLIALADGRLSLLSTVGTNTYYPYLADAALSLPYQPGPSSTILRRFTVDGKTDPTFGTVTLSAAGSTTTLAPIDQAVDADGRIVLTGGGADGLGIERLAANPVSLPSAQPTVYVSGANGSVEAFQRGTDGRLVSAGTYTPFAGYTGTVRVATGDLNGDGFTDTVFATGDRGSKVRVLLGLDPAIRDTALIAPIDFEVFEATFDGGVGVAVGDIDGDGNAEIVVTPNVGGSGRVVVYSLVDGKPAVRANFFGIDDVDFRGGATCALGDTDGDGKMELIVAAGVGGGPRVAVFGGRTAFGVAAGLQPPKLLNDFFAFPGADAERLRNGVAVTAGDVNGDGVADVVFGGGTGGGARVYTVDGKLLSGGALSQLGNFFVAGNATTRDGVRLALKDLDGDGRPDLIVNATGTICRAYAGTGIAQPNAVEPGLLDEFDSLASGTAVRVYVG